MNRQRLISLAAGVGFLAISGTFFYKRNFVAGGLFVIGAILFFKRALPPAGSS